MLRDNSSAYHSKKLAAYMRVSESFDVTMMGTVLSFAPKREPSSVEKLLRG